MKLLVDSHALIWSVDDPTKLGVDAQRELRNGSNQILVSAATIWELSIKHGQGKLALSAAFRPWMTQAIAALGALILPITIEYAEAQSTLVTHHRDPFDRLLVAQSLVERIPIVSSDVILDRYGIARVW